MGFFRFVLVKYSRAFVERTSQGTSSLASRLTIVSLDLGIKGLKACYTLLVKMFDFPFCLAKVLHALFKYF